MTYEEAIKVIESNRPTSGYMMLCEALDIAKESIEKQIPKRPISVEKHYYICPSCKSDLGITEEDIYIYEIKPSNYCSDCGQKLSWVGDTE